MADYPDKLKTASREERLRILGATEEETKKIIEENNNLSDDHKYVLTEKDNDCLTPIGKKNIHLNFLKEKNDVLSMIFNRSKLDLAEDYHKIQPFFYDKNNLWWEWDFGFEKYNLVDDTDMICKIDIAVGRNSRLIQEKNNVIESLKIIGRNKVPKELPKTSIQFMNHIIDIKTGEKRKASPDYFCCNPIQWKLGESEDTPTLDKLFHQWVSTEEEVKLLYQIIAYCLLPSYPLHRVFALYGKGSNGKSVYLNILTKFLGLDNCCSSSFEGLTTNRFESAKLYKKLMCRISEIHDKTVSKTALFKNLSGDDTIGFEFKNKNPFDDHNYAKIVIATNIIPLSEDDTDGFFRRWLIVDFPNQFEDKKDIMAIIPDSEFEALSLKSLNILRELLETRQFSTDGDIEHKRKRYNERANPIEAFIAECCELDINADAIYSDVYSEYVNFLQARSFRIIAKNEFSKALRVAGFKVREKTISNFKTTYIEGLKLKIGQIGQIGHFSTTPPRVGTNSKQTDYVDSIDYEKSSRPEGKMWLHMSDNILD